MIIIRHRRNTDKDLANISTNHGAEIDIRSQGQHLVLHHEPYEAGNRFEQWLENYNHRMLILNVKEEGLEDRVLELMKKKQHRKFLLLGSILPISR